MTVRMRHTRGHTGNRRSHRNLAEPRLSLCPDCGVFHLRHRACARCGMYRGRQVTDTAARDARLARRSEKKLKSRGLDPSTAQKERAAPESAA